MLQGLFGSKSIEKILLFLIVNEKTYATQLHRFLNTSLTPLQKALDKLEKEGVVKSYYEGNIRFYHLNPQYPLLQELENLLKKAYILLSPREKSLYYYIKHVPTYRKSNDSLLNAVWEYFLKVKRVDFFFRSRGGDSGQGYGEVLLDKVNDATLIFHERGQWRGSHGREFHFRNVFRWTMNRIDQILAVEHLRFGPKHPVFLFNLIPKGGSHFESASTHLCDNDTYFGHLTYQPEQIDLLWRIIGPKKNDEVIYSYLQH